MYPSEEFNNDHMYNTIKLTECYYCCRHKSQGFLLRHKSVNNFYGCCTYFGRHVKLADASNKAFYGNNLRHWVPVHRPCHFFIVTAKCRFLKVY